ncbi:DUF885 family protein [Sphingomonas naphthae]|uniref:DUF885 family protein n=1 Tax=Sphingomonas naphthae TaxID=1813468 RepID=A0ABY7TH68_9SPHN|nr:DUF885 family protein [Sphingomonas naphthae]WCT72321.1 DUF885 family protein [Sphingomonas naphthae]
MRKAIAALALATASIAPAAPADDFKALLADHWRWTLANNPVLASRMGDRSGDGKLDDISLAGADRKAKGAQGFIDRLKAIPDTGLSVADRENKAVLLRLLGQSIEGNRFGQRQMLFTTYYSWFQGFASLADRSPFKTAADYRSYLDRLAAYPAYNAEAIKITAQAVAGGFTQPCDVLGGFDKTIAGLIAPDPAQSRFLQPFARARPGDMSEAEWAAAKARAGEIVTTILNPQHEKLLAFYRTIYLPKCRKTEGASSMPQGAAYYAFRVRAETTTDFTPDQIHRIGLSEVARIGAEMDALAKRADYPDRAAFVTKLRTDPAYYARTPEALMAVAALQAKRIDGMLPAWFATLPRLPYGIRAIPAETAEGTTTAYYGPGSPAAGIAGTYWVNTSKLDQRPLYELPALTAHESVPGHHNQIARAQELDLPEFRRNASFAAFTEGWGLYAEKLGIAMGLYDTPEKEMGRLSYEMWRACRLVVDTGIHSKGWTKAQAIAFMTEHTALSAANIEAEVNRYISWPGQALAYKLGELRILAIRARAEKALGARFDIRRFHDAVLGGGAIPLDVLEARMDAWVEAEKAAG